MPDILVRGLDAATVRKLKTRARRHGRSLQGEAKRVLEQAAGADANLVSAILDRWRTRFGGRRMSKTATLIREDRRR